MVKKIPPLYFQQSPISNKMLFPIAFLAFFARSFASPMFDDSLEQSVSSLSLETDADSAILKSPAFTPGEWSVIAANVKAPEKLKELKSDLYEYATLGPQTTIAKDISVCLVAFVSTRTNLVLEVREKEKSFQQFSYKFDRSIRGYDYGTSVKGNGKEETSMDPWMSFAGIYLYLLTLGTFGDFAAARIVPRNGLYMDTTRLMNELTPALSSCLAERGHEKDQSWDNVVGDMTLSDSYKRLFISLGSTGSIAKPFVDLSMEVQVICSADRAFAYMFGSEVLHKGLAISQAFSVNPWKMESKPIDGKTTKLTDMLYSAEFSASIDQKKYAEELGFDTKSDWWGFFERAKAKYE
jgi:hypothetical protein